MIYNYPNSSGVIKLTPTELSLFGIKLLPGDTLNIPAGNFNGLSATGINGTAANFITIKFNAGTHFSVETFTGDKDIIDCSFLIFDGIDVVHYTHATFSSIFGASHDITYQNCNFRNFTDQIAIEIGSNNNRKTFDRTKASTYYNLKFIRCLFDGTTFGPFIQVKQGITLDIEIAYCTFTNVRQPDSSQYPFPCYIWGFGCKFHHNKFSHIGSGGHLGMIQIYGYGDVYCNLFSDEWGNDVRCFPMGLNMPGYNTPKNRFWNNISSMKRKHAMFEFNCNSTGQYVNDGSGNYLNCIDNLCAFNTLYHGTFVDNVWVVICDIYGAHAVSKNNLIIIPEANNAYNPATDYGIHVLDGFAIFGPAVGVSSGNVQRPSLNVADFNPDTFSPVLGGTLVNNVDEDISFITTDFYDNSRKSGTKSDAGAVELQIITPPTVIAEFDILTHVKVLSNGKVITSSTVN